MAQDNLQAHIQADIDALDGSQSAVELAKLASASGPYPDLDTTNLLNQLNALEAALTGSESSTDLAVISKAYVLLGVDINTHITNEIDRAIAGSKTKVWRLRGHGYLYSSLSGGITISAPQGRVIRLYEMTHTSTWTTTGVAVDLDGNRVINNKTLCGVIVVDAGSGRFCVLRDADVPQSENAEYHVFDCLEAEVIEISGTGSERAVIRYEIGEYVEV